METKSNTPNIDLEKTKIMTSGPFTSLQIDGETMETMTDFNFLGSKITADGDCSQTNPDSILKSRNISLVTKSVYSKLWFFQ